MLRFNTEFLNNDQSLSFWSSKPDLNLERHLTSLQGHTGASYVIENNDLLFDRSFFQGLQRHKHIKQLVFRIDPNARQIKALMALVEDNHTLASINVAGKLLPQKFGLVSENFQLISNYLLFNVALRERKWLEDFASDSVELTIKNSRYLLSGTFCNLLIQHACAKRIVIDEVLTHYQFMRLSSVLERNLRIESIVINGKDPLAYAREQGGGVIGMGSSVLSTVRQEVNAVVPQLCGHLRFNQSLAQLVSGEVDTLKLPATLSDVQRAGATDCLQQAKTLRVLEVDNLNESLLALIPTDGSLQELRVRGKITDNHYPMLGNFLTMNNSVLEVFCQGYTHEFNELLSESAYGRDGDLIRRELAVNRFLLTLTRGNFLNDFVVDQLVISDAKATIIANRLSTCQSIRQFTLKDSQISESGLFEIIHALTNNGVRSLRQLSLCNTPISARVYELLSNILGDQPYFTKLDLVNVGVTDDQVPRLADWLKSNPPLAVLNLHGNKIGNHGMSLLCQALETNSRISSLSIGGNSFDTTIIPAIIRLLSQNKVITHVSLRSSCMTENDVKSFVDDLKKVNYSVTDLVMSHHTQNNSYRKGGYNSPLVVTAYKKSFLDMIDKFNKKNAQSRDKLFMHIRRGEVKEVIKLFDKKVSPLCIDSNGDTALHVAVLQQPLNIPLVECLMQRGSHPFIMNALGVMPVDSLSEGSPPRLRQLLLNPPGYIPMQSTTSGEEPKAKKIKSEPNASIQSNTFLDNFLVRKKRTLIAETGDQPQDGVGSPDKKITKISSQSSEQALTPVIADVRSTVHLAYFAVLNNNTGLLMDALLKMNPLHVYQDGNTLWHLAADHNALECLHVLYRHREGAMILNAFQQLPLHLACAKSHRPHADESLELLIAANPAAVNAIDAFGQTPLFCVAGGFLLSPVDDFSDRMRAVAAKMLLSHGADPNAVFDDLTSPHRHCSVLQKTVSRGYYRLAKVLMTSPRCNLSHVDAQGWSVVHYAVHYGQVELLARLLIQPQIRFDLFDQNGKTARQMAREGQFASSVLNTVLIKEKIEALFELRSLQQIPAMDSAVHWVKNLAIRFGSRLDRNQDLILSFNEEHASLQNAVRPQLQNPGNILSASLTFIVSRGAHQVGANLPRVAIKVNITFTPKFHATNAWQTESSIEKSDTASRFKKFKRSPDALERIVERFEAAPDDIKASAVDHVNQDGNPLNRACIERLFSSTDDTAGDYDFEKHFHHSEHALFDHLQQPDVIENILRVLQANAQFEQGCKVFAVVLNAFSKNYLCPDCLVATMGFQNTAQGAFFTNLKSRLNEVGCALPRFSDLRAITLFSAHQPYRQVRKDASDHEELVVDIRAYPNNKILSQDSTAIQSDATLFTSRK